MRKYAKSGIYRITNLINNKIYIGRAVDLTNRKSDHKVGRDRKSMYIDRAILKHGWSNFKWEILELCRREELTEREQYYLDYLEPFADNGRGYNILKESGASPFKNRKHTEEWKKRISENSKGKWFGHPLKHVIKIDKITGEELEEFNSIKEANISMNKSEDATGIRYACKGMLKTSFGFRWRWKEDIDN